MKEVIFNGIEIAEDLQEKILTNLNPILKERDAKANENANRILDSVANSFSEKYGVQRLINETKVTEFIPRAIDELAQRSLKTAESEIQKREKQIAELTEKIKAGITDETTKKELDLLKSRLGETTDALENERKRIKEIETQAENKVFEYRKQNDIKASLPEFDKNINKYELAARQNEAIQKLNDEFNLKYNSENELIAENKQTFQTRKVKEILSEYLSDLLPNSVQGGGGKPPKAPVNGSVLTFTSDMTPEQKTEMIESHLRTKYKSKLDKGYSEDFEKLMAEAFKKK